MLDHFERVFGGSFFKSASHPDMPNDAGINNFNSFNGSININGSDIVNGSERSNRTRGNDKLDTTVLELMEFSSIEISSAIQVDFKICKNPSLSITADSNLIEFIEIETRGDILMISVKEGVSFSTKNPVLVSISHPLLTAIDVKTASKITVTDLDERSLDITATTSSFVKLQGSVECLTVCANTASRIDAKQAVTQTLKVKCSTAGYVVANSRQSVNAKATTAGYIEIYGKPKDRSIKSSTGASIVFS